MTLVVIDGMGGGMGAQLIEAVRGSAPKLKIIAVGTNTQATAAMLRAGADAGATGENPVTVNCRRADIIAGPIGILAADSLLGEITPKMAAAVGSSEAKKVLVPMSGCGIRVAGLDKLSTSEYITAAAAEILALLREGETS
ncbi:MAG: DUF3842 family protein [Clostridia bacterium]|nr:DUF3842 family protein [Clostridia bacterium]